MLPDADRGGPIEPDITTAKIHDVIAVDLVGDGKPGVAAKALY
jgi:hypothetical protein